MTVPGGLVCESLLMFVVRGLAVVASQMSQGVVSFFQSRARCEQAVLPSG